MNPFYDPTHENELVVAATIVSMIQFSNLNAILILPVKFWGLFLTDYFIIVILAFLSVYNLFICNLQHKYIMAEEKWKKELSKKRRMRGVFLIFFMIISIVLLVVAYNTIYE
ncbi:MAG: hypothetical protein IKQ94_07735 [Bacteroidales bacterium]|nr:hypothetical protein [Bacteroidales bacterium]